MRLDHVAVAVRDVEEAKAKLLRIPGARLLGEGEVREERIRVAVVAVGDVEIELMEPTGEGAVARFLEKRGPGIHHLAWRVEDLARWIQDVKDAGLEVLYDPPRKGWAGRWVTFLHPRSTGGLLLELCGYEEVRRDAEAEGP